MESPRQRRQDKLSIEQSRATNSDVLSPSIHCGACESVLETFAPQSIDLIITSPPYADQRRGTYAGAHPDDYVDWFVPKARLLQRVLKPSGTFILNIKEKVVNGERHTYVLELIQALRKDGWLWTEEFIWHKKNCYPGKWPNRFRDAWERCLQFNVSRNFYMNQDAVRVPMGRWAKTRLRHLSATDRRRDESKVASGFGKNVSKWVGRTEAYPTNVLHLATECSNRSHSAAFPLGLPEWFIRLFSTPRAAVLDPFMGSGTTLIAAQSLRRRGIGIDIRPEYCELARRTLGLEATTPLRMGSGD